MRFYHLARYISISSPWSWVSSSTSIFPILLFDHLSQYATDLVPSSLLLLHRLRIGQRFECRHCQLQLLGLFRICKAKNSINSCVPEGSKGTAVSTTRKHRENRESHPSRWPFEYPRSCWDYRNRQTIDKYCMNISTWENWYSRLNKTDCHFWPNMGFLPWNILIKYHYPFILLNLPPLRL